MEFSEHQRLFLAVICKHFHETGTWPTFGMIDRLLRSHRDLDVEQVAKELDNFIHDSIHAPLSGWEPTQRVTMNVSAFYACYSAGICSEVSHDLDAFAALVRLCVKRYDASEEEKPITSDDFQEEYSDSLFGGVIGNVIRLVEVEGFQNGIGYDDVGLDERPSWWRLTVPISIRKYRDVNTIEEYIEVRRSLLRQSLPPSIAEMLLPPSSSPTAGPLGATNVAASTQRGTSLPIFISYRRNDSAGHAGRLRADLAKRYGEDKVFMDLEIEPGVDFIDTIRESVGSCAVLLALIGRYWLTMTDENSGMRRLDSPDDFVRTEIATALERKIRVIPVVVHGAHMPTASTLLENLKPLARRQAHEITDSRWDFDVGRLVSVVDRVIGFKA